MTNEKYLEKYPWLKGYDPYPENGKEDVCSLMWLPNGWVEAFGELMCEELDVALKKTDHYAESYVSEAKEKYAGMRLSIYPSNEEIENIIRKYEAISEAVCQYCGSVDSPVLNLGGWLSVCCESCYSKINANGRYKPYVEIANKDAQMPTVVKWSRYSKDGRKDFEMDISGTVKKIRERYEQRKLNGEFEKLFEEWEDNYYGA